MDTLIDVAGNLGAGLGQGLANYQQGRVAKRKDLKAEVLEAWSAGDHGRALQLAQEADKVSGLFGPLSPPRGPAPTAPMKTITEQAPGPSIGEAPSPRGLAAGMPTPGTPTPRFGLEPNQGLAAGLPTSLGPPPAEPNQGLAGLAAYRGAGDPITTTRQVPDESDPGFIEALRKYVGAPAPKPEYFNMSPGDVRYSQIPGQAPVKVASGAPKPTATSTARPVQNPVTGEWFVPVPGLKTDVKPDKDPNPRLVQNPATGEWFTPTAGMTTTPPPRMVAITNADGSVTWAPTTPGAPVQQKPPTPPRIRTLSELKAEAEVAIPAMKPGKVKRVDTVKWAKWIAKEQAKDQAADKAYRAKYGGGGGGANPSEPQVGSGGAPVRGTMNVAPPTKYEDVALLPEWEGRLQAALKVAPGATISSRARSVARNAQAKPGGGAPDSWHTHRQAFDVVNYTAAQKAKLRAWAAKEGIHMIDEGNHLHFEPLRTSAAEAPALAAFYERHGIAPGDNHA